LSILITAKAESKNEIIFKKDIHTEPLVIPDNNKAQTENIITGINWFATCLIPQGMYNIDDNNSIPKLKIERLGARIATAGFINLIKINNVIACIVLCGPKNTMHMQQEATTSETTELKHTPTNIVI
jgi:hypothetical protein